MAQGGSERLLDVRWPYPFGGSGTISLVRTLIDLEEREIPGFEVATKSLI
jgi:hypothetical protein